MLLYQYKYVISTPIAPSKREKLSECWSISLLALKDVDLILQMYFSNLFYELTTW